MICASLIACRKSEPIEFEESTTEDNEYRGQTEAVETEQTTEDETAKRELSDEEKAYFTEWANEIENNGFLLSDYDRPEEINFDYVFYNGAGIQSDEEEDILQYFYNPTCEFWGDKMFLRKPDVDAFVKSKTGISIDDATRFTFRYSEEIETYLFEATDCMFYKFECTNGIKDGEQYILDFRDVDEFGKDTTLTMRYDGDDFYVVENHPKQKESEYYIETESYEDGTVEKYYNIEQSDEPYQTIRKNLNENTIYTNYNGVEKWFVYDEKNPLFSVTYDKINADELCMRGICKQKFGVYFRSELSWGDSYDEYYLEGYTRYGDKIRVIEEIGDDEEYISGVENPEIHWTNQGERELILRVDSMEFNPYENNPQVKDIMENLLKGLGKKIGDTFEVSDEGTGGGSIYRRYTILEIM